MRVQAQSFPQGAFGPVPHSKSCGHAQPAIRFCPCAQRPLSNPQTHDAPSSFYGQRGTTDSLVCFAAATAEYGQLGDLGVPQESYVVLGLAHCFEKNIEGKLSNRLVIEPISANSLECMVLGAKTCFKTVTGLVLTDALAKDKSRLPDEFQEASWCSDFEFRCGASARTWLRPHAQDNLLDLVPLGQTRSKFNFNLDEKRVLNFENEVSDSDNIKQDMSIDVYGRKEKEDEAPAAAPAAEDSKAPAAQEADDDDLDSLLSA